MIEVEKNFDLKTGDKERIVAGGEFIARKTFTDIYFDSPNFGLTTRDFWLRSRDGKFELKVPLNRDSIARRATDQYRELETEDEIAQELGFSAGGAFSDRLARAGYQPFATIKTTREKWRKGEFNLDFDEMDFGFTTFEVEIMVETSSEIPAAEEKIMGFAGTHGIAASGGHGKVIEFLFRYNPIHYELLRKHGVVAQENSSMRENPRKLWFRAKSYGWGWTPVTWEGWLVTGVYIIFVTAATSWVTKRAGGGFIGQSGAIGFIGVILLATAILITICYLKCERPRWRWGKSDEEK